MTHHSRLLVVGSSAKARRGAIRTGTKWQGCPMGQGRLPKAGGGPGGEHGRAWKGPKRAPTDGRNFACPFQAMGEFEDGGVDCGMGGYGGHCQPA